MGPFTVGEVPAAPQVFNMFENDGSPKDLTGYDDITANMQGPDGTVVHPGVVDAVDVNFSNRAVLEWGPVSPFPTAGNYRIQLQFNGPGTVLEYSAWAAFEVQPVAPGTSIPTWATISDCLRITKTAVDDDDLVCAQMIIDSVTNRTPAVSGSVRARDIEWLKRAVCYQAAWQLGQPDLFTRSAIGNITNDGVAATFTSKAAIYLAPLAIRSIKNLTWMRSRSLRLQTPFVDRDGGSANPLVDDSLWNWQALGMGTSAADFSTPWYMR